MNIGAIKRIGRALYKYSDFIQQSSKGLFRVSFSSECAFWKSNNRACLSLPNGRLKNLGSCPSIGNFQHHWRYFFSSSSKICRLRPNAKDYRLRRRKGLSINNSVATEGPILRLQASVRRLQRDPDGLWNVRLHFPHEIHCFSKVDCLKTQTNPSSKGLTCQLVDSKTVVKDRFRNTPNSGYGDILLNVKCGEITCELQLQTFEQRDFFRRLQSSECWATSEG